MSRQPTEEERLQRAIVGMTAPDALRFLAELLRHGGSLARRAAIAGHMETVAATLGAQQAVVREGVPVDSLDDTVLSLREYAVETTHPDGTSTLATYGDRLYSAVRDTTRARERGDAELLCRDVVISPWRPGPDLHPSADTPPQVLAPPWRR
jgi:hypothetical protein